MISPCSSTLHEFTILLNTRLIDMWHNNDHCASLIIPILYVWNAKLVNYQEMKRICGVHLKTFRLFKFLNVGKILTKGQTKYLRPNQTVKFSQWKRQALCADFFSVYLGNSLVLYLAVCCMQFCYLCYMNFIDDTHNLISLKKCAHRNMDMMVKNPSSQGRRQRGGSGARRHHLNSVPPISMFGLPVAAYIQYCIWKCSPPCGFWSPCSEILSTGLHPAWLSGNNLPH